MITSYQTIAKPSEGLYKEKGSKFIAYAYPCANEEEFKKHLNQLKSDYHDARHHCYAFSCNPDKSLYRYSDDGEPSGTAGKPIYGQLLSFELTNVCIIVLRYFGGTKLGVGGLINAYREAAKDALNNGQIIEQKVFKRIEILFQYDQMNSVMSLTKSFDLSIENQEFDNDCKLIVRCNLEQLEATEGKLTSLQNVAYKILA